MSAEKRLKELGIDLPQVPAPVANYVNAVRTGNLLFLAGKGPGPVKGKLGREFTVDQGYQHARAVAVDRRRFRERLEATALVWRKAGHAILPDQKKRAG